jgi:chaperonin GroES
MSVKPLEDRVLVKPIESEAKTASGIYLPEASKEKPVRGEVVAVGPGKRLDNGKRGEMSVRKGDTVCTASTRAPRWRSRASST